MHSAPDTIFRTLADPTRRAAFERLAREGEQTVGALTSQSGVSQPAVSKHLAVLKLAGLVRDRHAGRLTHYSAEPQGLKPVIDLDGAVRRLLARPVRCAGKPAEQDGSMTELATATRSLVVEREMPHPPEKIWGALTQAALIEAWLMKNDFQPSVGHRFNFRAAPIHGWNGVTDCEVLEIVPCQRLVYSWNASGDQAPDGLKTIVTWTLTQGENGTRVRMEQTGFRPQDEAGYRGMGGGWPRILAKLEDVAARS